MKFHLFTPAQEKDEACFLFFYMIKSQGVNGIAPHFISDIFPAAH